MMRTILLSFAALATACRAQEPATAEATRPVADGPSAAGRLVPTEDALMTYVVWTRDWKLLTNRHKAEADVAGEQAAAKLSLKDIHKVARDPDLLATIERQGAEMKAHFARLPRGPMASGFQATLEGIGAMVPLPSGYLYVPGRNEEALATARKVHGDAFVDWVLEREATIVAILSE